MVFDAVQARRCRNRDVVDGAASQAVWKPCGHRVEPELVEQLHNECAAGTAAGVLTALQRMVEVATPDERGGRQLRSKGIQGCGDA